MIPSLAHKSHPTYANSEKVLKKYRKFDAGVYVRGVVERVVYAWQHAGHCTLQGELIWPNTPFAMFAGVTIK